MPYIHIDLKSEHCAIHWHLTVSGWYNPFSNYHVSTRVPRATSCQHPVGIDQCPWINVLLIANVQFNATNGVPGWALIHLSWFIRVLWRSRCLLRCSLGPRKITILLSQILRDCLPQWGEALSIPSWVMYWPGIKLATFWFLFFWAFARL